MQQNLKETGNVVISKEDFNEFLKKVEAAKTITDDYEHIKTGNKLKELEKDYKEVRGLFLETYDMYQTKKRENNELKEENKEIKDDLSNTNKLLYHCKIAISKLLEEINRMIFDRSDFVDRIRGLGKDDEKAMNVMRIVDQENNPEYYQKQVQEEQQEQKNEPKRNKGMTR